MGASCPGIFVCRVEKRMCSFAKSRRNRPESVIVEATVRIFEIVNGFGNICILLTRESSMKAAGEGGLAMVPSSSY